MRVLTSRFGEIEIDEKNRLLVPVGILGFPNLTRYALYKPKELGFFSWLQSEEVKELAFVVCDPRLLLADYRIEVRVEDLKSIHLESKEDAAVLVILTYPHDPRRMTANLLGPIIVNTTTGEAVQIVLNDGKYETNYRVFPHLYQGPEEGEKAVQECA